MKRVEMHVKTKYSAYYDSTIDIEALLWNAHENGEEGIVVVDKDSCLSFPKVEEIYNKLCIRDKSFKDFKVGYGIELTSIVKEKQMQIVILVKNQIGLKNLYKIFTLYLCKYDKKIPIHEVMNNRDGILIGLILNETQDLDLSIFDYIEISKEMDVSKIRDNNTIIYSNVPNAILPGDKLGHDILNIYKNDEEVSNVRLYLDTEEALTECSDEELVIKNTNIIFDELEKIIINDDKFYTKNIDNFDDFKCEVIELFNKKYKNTNEKLKTRLDQELSLIHELNYGYFYKFARFIVRFLKENNEYYQINGYINNSLVAYVLNITDIEPYNLPLELFFSEIPNLEIVLSPEFYKEKLLGLLQDVFSEKLIFCNYTYKLDRFIFSRIMKKYFLKTKNSLNLKEKDYVYTLLEGMPLRFITKNNMFYLIPDNMEIYDFTPLYPCDDFNSGTYFDYTSLKNNLIRINFVLYDDVSFVSNLRDKKMVQIPYMNDSKVLDLFRSTEGLVNEFKILNRKTGLLNISYFSNPDLEIKFKNAYSFSVSNLIEICEKLSNLINKDDLYVILKKSGLDDLEMFNIINYLGEQYKHFISKANLLNKIKLAYIELYYKLYYPKIYYQELLDNIMYSTIRKDISNMSIDKIINNYLELNEKRQQNIPLDNYEEFNLLEILIEMYERKIDFKFIDEKVMVI